MFRTAKTLLETRPTDTAMNHFKRFIGPKMLSAVNEKVLGDFTRKLQGTKLADTSVASYLRQLRAALGWAVEMKLMAEVPTIKMPSGQRGNGSCVAVQSRPRKYERMMAVTPQIRREDAEAWRYYQTGLWLSGLRLEESTIFSSDENSPISVDLSGGIRDSESTPRPRRATATVSCR